MRLVEEEPQSGKFQEVGPISQFPHHQFRNPRQFILRIGLEFNHETFIGRLDRYNQPLSLWDVLGCHAEQHHQVVDSVKVEVRS